MTLCSDEEWVQACEGQGTTWAYPYHATDYDGAACNTRDEGDHIYDSCVILDNFQWVTSPVDGPVTIK